MSRRGSVDKTSGRALAAIPLFLFFLLCQSSYIYAAENIRETASYPSPKGNYTEIRTTDRTVLATDGISSVSVGTTVPNAAASLTINSTTKGLLLPRMAVNPVAPAPGLLIYNTTDNRAEFANNSGTWFTLFKPVASSLLWADTLQPLNPWSIMSNKTGNVGIGGATAPTSKLRIATTGANNGILIKNAAVMMLRNGSTPFTFGVDKNDGYKFKIVQDGFINRNTQARLTLDTNGNLGIGTTNPAEKVDLVEGGNWVRIDVDGSSNGTTYPTIYSNVALQLNPSQAVELGLGATGNVGIGGPPVAGFKLMLYGDAAKPGGGNWTSYSDERLKTNVHTIGGALEKMSQLRGVMFEWKEPEKHGSPPGPVMGMIAQEVEPIFPGWVRKDGDGFRYLALDGFEALTVEALRELKQENEDLRARINKIKERKLKNEKHGS